MEKLLIIKIGGKVIDHPDELRSFLKQFSEISGKKMLVHGGGKIASSVGRKLGIEPAYYNGRRITDEATMDLVTMVYGGLVNKRIVAALQALNCNALGLSGADANILPATKRPVWEVDYGFAGDINTTLSVASMLLFLNNKLVPVISPLTHDGNGQMLNTNADSIASALAVELSAEFEVRLIYCFEKKGILENIDDESSLIPVIDKEKYKQLMLDKKLADGILPKIDNAFTAVEKGVKEVLIVDAGNLLENITGNVNGTLFKK